MIKLVATDIDGTILGLSANDFTPEVKNCIQKLENKGIKVVLVTGRMHSAACNVSKTLHLKTPIVSFQGGLVKDLTSGETLYEKTLSPTRAEEIITWARKNNIHVNLYLNDTLYVEKDCEEIHRYVDRQKVPYTVCNFDKLELKHINKILLIDYENEQRVTDWLNHLQTAMPEVYVVKSTPSFCEVSNAGATKACAVRFLQNYWGISPEETLTIGDQNNDIELLKAGGISVAMGNATEELKTYADYITDTVDNDGFVKAMEKFCF